MTSLNPHLSSFAHYYPGQANGLATLDGTGKVPLAQLPSVLSGSLDYQGLWDANANNPALVSSSGTKGQYYKVSTAGSTSINGINTWDVGDLILYNGSSWDRIDGGSRSEVLTVNGKVGPYVTLTASDVGALSSGSLDGDLTTIAGLSGTGFLKRTGTNAWALDTNTYLTANQSISVSGDATGSGTTSIALTLANSGVTAGTYGSSTTTPVISIDAKGRITGALATTIQPNWSSIVNRPTSLSQFTNDTGFLTQSTDLANSLSSGYGWQKFGDGLMVQWGTGVFSLTGQVYVTFNVNFPAHCIIAYAHFDQPNITSYLLTPQNTSTSGTTFYYGGGNTFNFKWIAFGY